MIMVMKRGIKKTKKKQKTIPALFFITLIAIVALIINLTFHLKEPQITGRAGQNPPFFHEFYGTVSCSDGKTVPNSYLVSANVSEGSQSVITEVQISGGTYHIFVDGYNKGNIITFYINNVNSSTIIFDPSASPKTLNLIYPKTDICTSSPPPGGNGGGGGGGGGGGSAADCFDKKDNDGDGLIDLADPGCSNIFDDDETNVVTQPQCNDGRDNDGDGLIDLADPGCSNSSDNDESGPIIETPIIKYFEPENLLKTISILLFVSAFLYVITTAVIRIIKKRKSL